MTWIVAAVASASIGWLACGADERAGTTDTAPEAVDAGDTTLDAADATTPPDATPADATPPDATTTDATPADATTQDVTPADAPADTTVTPDAADDVPAVVTCPTPDFVAQYPPPFPPFPYGQWPLVEGCLAAPHDVIIVLGCPSEDDGAPAPCQERRAEMADQLFEAGWSDRFIVSGAAVHTPWVEADALAALLVARGIPDEAIVREPLARHTDENIYYATRIMQQRGWRSAIVVSEDPGHLMYTGLCDANCCVGLGRMTLVGFPVEGVTIVNAGHYTLAPPGPDVTAQECAHLAALALCVNLDDRLACEDDFQLDE